MLKKIQSNQLVLLAAVFVIVNSVLLANEFFWLNLVPILIGIVFFFILLS